jgi:hypothetical protein
MRNARGWGWSFVSLLLGVHCSGSSGGGSVSASQAASDVATASCALVEQCAPALVELEWGTPGTCVSRLTGVYAGTVASTGTSDTPSQIEACAQALPSVTCDAVLGRNLPAPCRAQPGSLANGAACGDDSQCSGGRCSVPSNQTCGVCAALAEAGGACSVDGDCDHGLACAKGQCAAYVVAGGSCDATHPCVPTLACKNGACATPDPAGTSCTPNAPDTCDNLHGVFCNSQSSQCQAIGYANAGGACGFVSGTLTVCQGGGTNVVAECKGLAVTSPTGTCQLTAADGASCNASAGPFCVPPSVCVNGTCALDDPSTCH